MRVTTGDGDQLIGARRAVVLASGGFEWNKQMVAGFIGQEIMPLSPPHNEGDGHRMAMEAGAQLANMMSFWGQPALLEPGFEIDGREVPQMASIRSMPGVMIVNRYGDRFVNEGATYQDLPKAMATYDPVAVDYPNRPPTWIVFDQHVRNTAVVLPSVLPGQPTPDWIFTAPTIGELADQIGAPPERLEAHRRALERARRSRRRPGLSPRHVLVGGVHDRRPDPRGVHASGRQGAVLRGPADQRHDRHQRRGAYRRRRAGARRER